MTRVSTWTEADVTVTCTLLGSTPRLAAVVLTKVAWSKLFTSPGTTKVNPTTRADRPPGVCGGGGDGGGDGPGDGGGGGLGMNAGGGEGGGGMGAGAEGDGGGVAGDGGGIQAHSHPSECPGIWPYSCMAWRAAIGLLKPPSVCPPKPKLHVAVGEVSSRMPASGEEDSKIPRKAVAGGITYGWSEGGPGVGCGVGCGSGCGEGDGSGSSYD